VLGEFEAQLRNFPGAANHLHKALRLTCQLDTFFVLEGLEL
jgi:hypothetical protein